MLEVDGRHHYADPSGVASPQLYATMAAEDRRLRLVGYEVFRFGGAELTDTAQGRAVLEDFFFRLLEQPKPEHL